METIIQEIFFVFFVIQFSFICGNSIKVSIETLIVPNNSKNGLLFKPIIIHIIENIKNKKNINL